jgi:DNA-binding response OmpR family regulator
MVIEDEPSILKALIEVLQMNGYEVASAVNGEQGLNIIADFKPDMILLDLILPGKNGFEVLKEVKASPENSHIPVIILSNLGDEEEIQQGLKLGATDFLIKADYDLSEVVKIIAKYLKK